MTTIKEILIHHLKGLLRLRLKEYSSFLHNPVPNPNPISVPSIRQSKQILNSIKPPPNLRMNRRLHLRINPHHPLIQIRMIPHQHLGIPRTRHENGIHPAADRRHEDLTHLQPYQERESHDDGRELAAFVVLGFGEFEVEECEEGAEVGDKGAAHCEDGADEAVVDEGVDAAVFHHPKNSVFSHVSPL